MIGFSIWIITAPSWDFLASVWITKLLLGSGYINWWKTMPSGSSQCHKYIDTVSVVMEYFYNLFNYFLEIIIIAFVAMMSFYHCICD